MTRVWHAFVQDEKAALEEHFEAIIKVGVLHQG